MLVKEIIGDEPVQLQKKARRRESPCRGSVSAQLGEKLVHLCRFL
jgi:hypothetical protein